MGGLVWLASYPKSGNTWTRAFLHNLLRAKDESHDINKMVKLTAWDIEGSWYRKFLDKPVKQCSKEEVAAVRPQALRGIAESADGLVFVKTHNALVSDRGTPVVDMSVTAGAIYIVRNPLDVAISFAHHNNETIDKTIERMNTPGVETSNEEIVVYEVRGSWSENVDSWTRKPKRYLHVMRYEDMHEKPKETFGALAGFLRLQPTPEQLGKAIELSAFDKLRKQEDKHGFFEKSADAERFFRKGKTGEWKDVLTGPQIKAIVDTHRGQMERFGYVPRGY